MVKSISSLKQEYTLLEGKEIILQGWIRTNRAQKEFGFISLNDGSSVTNIQIVYDKSLENFEQVSKFRVGCSLTVTGTVVVTLNAKQKYELHATKIILEGEFYVSK